MTSTARCAIGRPGASSTRPSPRRARRCPSATWATGRSTTTAATTDRDYHELLREFLQSMCTRRLGQVYCQYARKYRGNQVDPPEVTYEGPALATEDEPVALRFSVSKLSAVQVTVTRPDGRVVFDRLA